MLTDDMLEVIKQAVNNGVYIKKIKYPYPFREKTETMKCIVSRVDFTDLDNPTLHVFGCIGYHFNWRDDEYVYDEKYLRNPKSHKLYDKCYSFGYYDTFTLCLNSYVKSKDNRSKSNGESTNDRVCWALTKEELEDEA